MGMEDRFYLITAPDLRGKVCIIHSYIFIAGCGLVKLTDDVCFYPEAALLNIPVVLHTP